MNENESHAYQCSTLKEITDNWISEKNTKIQKDAEATHVVAFPEDSSVSYDTVVKPRDLHELLPLLKMNGMLPESRIDFLIEVLRPDTDLGDFYSELSYDTKLLMLCDLFSSMTLRDVCLILDRNFFGENEVNVSDDTNERSDEMTETNELYEKIVQLETENAQLNEKIVFLNEERRRLFRAIYGILCICDEVKNVTEFSISGVTNRDFSVNDLLMSE